ncbi:YjcZ family sporulation protein [Bacillus sp. MRMR6]|nr:sporulation protein YjcZ [Bacillus sp. MRMR6]
MAYGTGYGYGYGCGYAPQVAGVGYRTGFTLIVVLFILLIIVGAAWC